MAFKIQQGIKNLQPCYAVIETRNGKVIQIKHFDYPKDKDDANIWIQQQLNMDRDFEVEGRNG